MLKCHFLYFLNTYRTATTTTTKKNETISFPFRSQSNYVTYMAIPKTHIIIITKKGTKNKSNVHSIQQKKKRKKKQPLHSSKHACLNTCNLRILLLSRFWIYMVSFYSFTEHRTPNSLICRRIGTNILNAKPFRIFIFIFFTFWKPNDY